MEVSAWCLSIKTKKSLHGFYPVAEYDISYLLQKGLCKYSQCLKPAVLRHSAGPPWHREGAGASWLSIEVGAQLWRGGRVPRSELQVAQEDQRCHGVGEGGVWMWGWTDRGVLHHHAGA